MYCKLVEHVPGQPVRNPQCRICNQNSSSPSLVRLLLMCQVLHLDPRGLVLGIHEGTNGQDAAFRSLMWQVHRIRQREKRVTDSLSVEIKAHWKLELS
ncbi:Laminin subunit alpha-2 [Heterocephalus glaber]|uniref:Laminin subunit alpha-2 n=1 Tax=Heterocephalus glaber TaxID=10181 RepID=G5C960_HETGA|nr:Laminin subunit alpha-2 [Heterocephalus glaber]